MMEIIQESIVSEIEQQSRQKTNPVITFFKYLFYLVFGFIGLVVVLVLFLAGACVFFIVVN